MIVPVIMPLTMCLAVPVRGLVAGSCSLVVVIGGGVRCLSVGGVAWGSLLVEGGVGEGGGVDPVSAGEELPATRGTDGKGGEDGEVTCGPAPCRLAWGPVGSGPKTTIGRSRVGRASALEFGRFGAADAGVGVVGEVGGDGNVEGVGDSVPWLGAVVISFDGSLTGASRVAGEAVVHVPVHRGVACGPASCRVTWGPIGSGALIEFHSEPHHEPWHGLGGDDTYVGTIIGSKGAVVATSCLIQSGVLVSKPGRAAASMLTAAITASMTMCTVGPTPEAGCATVFMPVTVVVVNAPTVAVCSLCD
jgi:hypothetical protein